MYKIVMLLIVGGACAAWHGYKEFRLNQCMSTEAKPMTCAELERDGPGENAHVRLSGHLLCSGAFVSEKREKYDPWTTIWIPAVSLNGEYADELRGALARGLSTTNVPPPRRVHVIVKSTHVHTPEQLDQLCGQLSIEGVVINKVESLGTNEMRMLARTYRGIDFSKCWVLEERREATSSAAAMGFMSGGVLACVGGFVLVARHH